MRVASADVALSKAGSLATRAAEALGDRVDTQDRAQAFLLLGDAIRRGWLTASEYPTLNERDRDRLRRQLRETWAAFHDVLVLAAYEHDPTLISKAWAQIPKTWTAELGSCGDLA